MTDLERDIKEMKEAIARIEKALGIGAVSPAMVVDIRDRAKRKAEKIGNKENQRK